jgi:hypothetical protein
MSEEQSLVYGEVYQDALTQMQLISSAISEQEGKGFNDFGECARWAHLHLLDIVVLSRGTHQYYYVSHKGDILTRNSWLNMYKDVIFTWEETSKGKHEQIAWWPKGFKYHDEAKINGEIEEYGHKPLYHRNYFTPTGFYDSSSGTFNIGKVQPIFARNTGRDTSHIYTFINAIAGECALHLLAWLRMKLVSPTSKTQVVPIIVSRAQGTGKTTFAEVICKGLFGKDNVLVTDQYDSSSRFNADYADALIVCHEEKEYEDKRNSAASIKSRATATTIRKEHKGLDPVYQESYTDFIMTSNKDVPIKFEDDTDQRRFMVMQADETFTRKLSPTADEVFTKLYGKDIHDIKTGIGFVDDNELIAQFKHELYTREDIKSAKVRNFPHTAAYEKCFTIPRTTEATEIESIVRSLAPFIKASLEAGRLITQVSINEGTELAETISLASYVQTPHSMQYFPAYMDMPAYIAICRPIVFYDQSTGKPYNHATVERGIYDCDSWLIKDYGVRVYPVSEAVPGGFFGVQGRHKNAPSARFTLADNRKVITPVEYVPTPVVEIHREGERLRVNGKWRPDPKGEYETVNEMKPGTITLADKTQNVQYMDTFLFEADDADPHVYKLEEELLSKVETVTAETLFRERLRPQLAEAKRLMREGKAWRIVYSGGKSYHVLVRVEDSPSSVDEYKWLHAHLCGELSSKVNYDRANTDPARLTRAPITFKREFDWHGHKVTGNQRLIESSPSNTYIYNWRPLYQQWLNRPLQEHERITGRRMMPCKPEYRDAALALLKGTFWTDATWSSRRQQCFFPAYRLCLELGYTHEQLWSENGILEGLNKYYRPSEIEYWRNREHCALIQEIERDFT